MEDYNITTIGGDFDGLRVFAHYQRDFLPMELFLSLVGFICSVMCISAFGLFESANSTTRFLLQMLSVADAVWLFLTILDFPLDVLQLRGFIFAFNLHPTLHNILLTAASWLALFVTFERYINVIRPDLAAKFSTPIRVRAAVGVVWIASLVVSLPMCFEYTIQGEYASRTVLSRSEVYFVMYYIIVHNLLCFTVPLLLKAFLLYGLVRHIRRSGNSTDRQPVQRDVIGGRMTSTVDCEREMTISWIIVALIIAAYESLSLIGIVAFLVDKYLQFIPPRTHWPLIVYTYLTLAIASFKILIYATTNANFRKALRDVMCFCCRRMSVVNDPAVERSSPYSIGFHDDTVECSTYVPL